MRGKNKLYQQYGQDIRVSHFLKTVDDDVREAGKLLELTVEKQDGGRAGTDVKYPKLQLLLTVLPVLSAALYLVGTMYHESYLAGFGVDNSMFPLPLDRVLLYGFTSLLSFGLVPVVKGISIAVLVFVAVMIAAVLSSFPKVQSIQASVSRLIRSKLTEIPSTPTPFLIRFVDKGGVLYFYLAGIFFLLMALVFTMLLSSDAGAKAAQSEKDKWKKGMHRSADVTIQGEPVINAFQVTCGSAYCAYWTGRETRIIRHEQVINLSVYPINKNKEELSK